MKIIKELSEMIEEELDGAENYVRHALMVKSEHPSLADVFYNISTQEMHHVDMLHDEVTKIIKAHREASGSPPEAMLAVYNWIHARQIEDSKAVKILQAEYREKM